MQAGYKCIPVSNASYVTLDKLISECFNVLLCKMVTMRHLLYCGAGRAIIVGIYVKHLEERLAHGKSYVRVRYSCSLPLFCC